jgi:hypothetical protein
MPNPIKYSTSAQTLALKKGNYWIGTGDVGKGPTSTTDYYNGITPPAGGYTIYLNKASGGPSIYTAANDSQLISLSNTISGQTFATAAAALAWFATQTDKMVFNIDYPAIVTNGLVLNLDAGFTPSYPTTGTTWYDVSSSGSNGTLTNGPTFSSSGGGSIVFDGVDDTCPVNNQTFNSTIGSSFTIETVFKRNSATPGIYKLLYLMGSGGSTNARIAFWFDNNSNGSMAINYYTAAGFDPYINLSSQLLDTNFHHAVQVVDKSTLQMTGYFDGVNKGSGAIESSSTSSTTFTIAGTLACPATVALVRIYNRALSQSEITQNYNAQKSRFGL